MSSPPIEIVAVEFVNREKHIINFVKDKNTFGFFNYSENQIRPRIGDLLKVKMVKGTNNYYKVLSLSKGSQTDTCEAVKSFSGKVSMNNKNGLGFVDDVFLYPQLMRKFGLKDGIDIHGKAIYSYDKKKDAWGWKAFWIDNAEAPE